MVMFRKIVSRLPYQPSLLVELVYYSHRLRQEQSMRRLGLVMMAILLALQTSMIIFPAKPSVAASASDIVYGATSKQDVLTAYRSNRDQLGRTDVQKIFNHYGISEQQIELAKTVTISDGDGRSYINTSRSTTKFPDTFVTIPGANNGGIYEFPLSYWRKGEFPNGYPAITGMSSYGFRFWILLKGCGNIVFEQDAKKPNFEIKKQLASPESAKPGDAVSYQIQFRNNGFATAKNTSIVDTLPEGFEYISFTSNTDIRLSKSGRTLRWTLNTPASSLPVTSRWFTISLQLRAKQNSFGQMCNTATITADGSISATAVDPKSSRCVTIVKPVCPGTGLAIPANGISGCTITCSNGQTIAYNQNCPVSQLVCASLSIINTPRWNERQAKVTILAQPGAEANNVRFYVDEAFISTQTVKQQTANTTLVLTEGTHKISTVITAKKGEVGDGNVCTSTVEIKKPIDTPIELATEKRVSNNTKNINDANNTTASAGDLLKYTIVVKNIGTVVANDLKLEGEYGESVSDVLEYATLEDKGDALFDPKSQFLTWPAVTIAPGETIEKSFTVRIKSPIPATPVSLSNPLSYDAVLHNKYGNDVYIRVDRSPVKVVEQTVTTLPNTGPGSTMIITWLFTTVLGYFYYRSRLLIKETALITKAFNGGP